MAVSTDVIGSKDRPAQKYVWVLESFTDAGKLVEFTTQF